MRNIDWLGSLFFIGSISCLILAITFGDSVFSWRSASEIVLWVMTGVLFLAFILIQTFNPLVNEECKLYPTTFLRHPVLVMLQIAIFMSSASLLVSHIICFSAYLRKIALNTDLDTGILYTALLPIHSGTSIPLDPLYLRYRHDAGFLSHQLCGPPPPLCGHVGRVHPRQWGVDAEAWLLHAVVSSRWRSRTHWLSSHVYVGISLNFPKI